MATLPPRITEHETTIFTDHKNLTYFRKAQKLNRRQARWSLLLSEYNIKLVHLPGSKMILSDALSRRPDMIPDKDHDNEDMYYYQTTYSSTTTTIDMELQQKIATQQHGHRSNRSIEILY
jgi:hypothetical protein